MTPYCAASPCARVDTYVAWIRPRGHTCYDDYVGHGFRPLPRSRSLVAEPSGAGILGHLCPCPCSPGHESTRWTRGWCDGQQMNSRWDMIHATRMPSARWSPLRANSEVLPNSPLFASVGRCGLVPEAPPTARPVFPKSPVEPWCCPPPLFSLHPLMLRVAAPNTRLESQAPPIFWPSSAAVGEPNNPHCGHLHGRSRMGGKAAADLRPDGSRRLRGQVSVRSTIYNYILL